MSLAWLTARPVAHRGLHDAARGVIPDAVIDREKGYFPVPALKALQGPYVEMLREALHAPEAQERAIFDADVVDKLLRSPNDAMTNLGGNVLWQVGVLELWLQAQGV